jgi:hypothetical protein
VNDKRAPKNGSLADIVEEDEDLDICVVIKGADDIPGLWIPIETVTPVAAKKEGSKTPYTSNKKRKSTAVGVDTSLSLFCVCFLFLSDATQFPQMQ